MPYNKKRTFEFQAHVNNLVQQQAAHAEPAFVQERAREYGKRLQKAAHAICLKHAAASTTAGSHSDPGAATTTGSAPMADLSGSKAELEKVLYGQVRRSNITLQNVKNNATSDLRVGVYKFHQVI